MIASKDNHIRLARLDTVRGQLLRPIQRLYRLHLECLDHRCIEESPASGATADVGEDASDSKSAGVTDVFSDVQSRAPHVKITRKGRLVKMSKRWLH